MGKLGLLENQDLGKYLQKKGLETLFSKAWNEEMKDGDVAQRWPCSPCRLETCKRNVYMMPNGSLIRSPLGQADQMHQGQWFCSPYCECLTSNIKISLQLYWNLHGQNEQWWEHHFPLPPTPIGWLWDQIVGPYSLILDLLHWQSLSVSAFSFSKLNLCHH